MSFNKFDRPNFQQGRVEKQQYPQNRFDKPYITPYFIDPSKITGLFNIFTSTFSISELQIYCLKNKISMNQSDEDGNNLIHHVLLPNELGETDKLEIIKFLVDNDVNPEKFNKQNITPLHIACEEQYEQIIKYLLTTVQVEPNPQDNMGNTPFHYLLAGKIIPYEETKKRRALALNIPITGMDYNEKLFKFSNICDPGTPPKISLKRGFFDKKTGPFILYMINSSNNTNEKFDELYINQEIITILLEKGGNPYMKNLHGIPPIDNVINTFNYHIFDKIKETCEEMFEFKELYKKKLNKQLTYYKELPIASKQIKEFQSIEAEATEAAAAAAAGTPPPTSIGEANINTYKTASFKNTNIKDLINAIDKTKSPTTPPTSLYHVKDPRIEPLCNTILHNIAKTMIILRRIQETIKLLD
jgi:hypothetical protein